MKPKAPLRNQLTWRLGSTSAADRALGAFPRVLRVARSDTEKSKNPGGWYVFRCDGAAREQLQVYRTVRRMGYQAYCPTRVQFEWKNKFNIYKKKKVFNYFSLVVGYMLIRMPVNEMGVFFLVKPAAIWSVLGFNGVPLRVPFEQVEQLIHVCKGGEHIAPDHYRYMETHGEFDVGDHVSIESGGFSERYGGERLQVRKIVGSRAVLELELFGRTVQVPVPVGHLRKAG